jgi:hypothetical protein
MVSCATTVGGGYEEWSAALMEQLAANGGSAGGASLQRGPSGWPVLSYIMPVEFPLPTGLHLDCLRYASYEPQGTYPPPDPGSGWSLTTPYVAPDSLPDDPNDPSGQPGSATSLAFDQSGTPGIALAWKHREYPGQSGGTMYAAFMGPDGGIRRVAKSPNAGMLADVCLAYRTDDKPGVTFQGESTDPGVVPLKYAVLESSGGNEFWWIRPVDWIGERGQRHSLASDPNGWPAVAYVDKTERRLMYAVAADRPDTYTLTADVLGAGSVSTAPNPNPDWGGQYAYGTVVTASEAPGPHWHFLYWEVFDPNFPNDPCHAAHDANDQIPVLMDRDRHVRACFDPNVYQLTLTVSGGGTVTKDPNEDPNWGGYLYPTVVTLTAHRNTGQHFVEWQIFDPCHPSDANYATKDSNEITHVLMDADKHVSAQFECNNGSGIPLAVVAFALFAVKVRSRRRFGGS